MQGIVQPCARRPVDIDLRRGQEGSPTVEDFDGLEAGLSEDRSFDTSDSEAQSGRRLDLRNAVDDEAVPGRRVEQDQADGGERHDGQHKGCKLDRQPSSPVSANAKPPALFRFGGCGLGHSRTPVRGKRQPRSERPQTAG